MKHSAYPAIACFLVLSANAAADMVPDKAEALSFDKRFDRAIRVLEKQASSAEFEAAVEKFKKTNDASINIYKDVAKAEANKKRTMQKRPLDGAEAFNEKITSEELSRQNEQYPIVERTVQDYVKAKSLYENTRAPDSEALAIYITTENKALSEKIAREKNAPDKLEKVRVWREQDKAQVAEEKAEIAEAKDEVREVKASAKTAAEQPKESVAAPQDKAIAAKKKQMQQKETELVEEQAGFAAEEQKLEEQKADLEGKKADLAKEDALVASEEYEVKQASAATDEEKNEAKKVVEASHEKAKVAEEKATVAKEKVDIKKQKAEAAQAQGAEKMREVRASAKAPAKRKSSSTTESQSPPKDIGKQSKLTPDINSQSRVSPAEPLNSTTIEVPSDNMPDPLFEEIAKEYSQPSFQCLGDYNSCVKATDSVVCTMFVVVCVAERLIPLAGG